MPKTYIHGPPSGERAWESTTTNQAPFTKFRFQNALTRQVFLLPHNFPVNILKLPAKEV